jgi:flagellar protein FliO/FliZ
VLFALALVLGAVALAAWLLRRFAPGQNIAGSAMRVVGGVAVGPKERIVLVEVGETWLVVGVAPGQVNALHTLPKQNHNAAVELPAMEQKNFSAWLRQAMQSRKPNS